MIKKITTITIGLIFLQLVLIVCLFVFLVKACDHFKHTKAGRETGAFVEEWLTPLDGGIEP